MKRILISFICLIVAFSAQSGNYRITGQILSKSDSTFLAGATILLKSLDSPNEKGAISDKQGNFLLEQTSDTNCLLKISFIGHEDYLIHLQGIKSDIHIGIIYLQEKAELLSEIVVETENVVYQSDKMIIYPQSIQLKHSNDVYDLMRKQGLPNLEVNRMERKMTIDGKAPLYKINGVPKAATDILTINPNDILRIDYNDTKTSRYADKNIGGVIDFILKERTEGGVFSLPLTASFSTKFIDAMPYFSFHKKKSEIAFQYYTNWRDYNKRATNLSESYVGNDFQTERELKGDESPFGYWNNGINATYTLQFDTSTNFTATLRNEFGKQHNTVNGIMTENENNPFFRHSKSTYHSYMPSLDLFFSKRWSNEQSLEINMVGSLLDSEYKYLLEEHHSFVKKHMNNVENSRQALISEIAYFKRFRNSSLNIGFQNTTSYTKNEYQSETIETDRLKQNNNYLYASWSGKAKNLSFTLGTGVKMYFVDNNKESRHFIRNHSTLSLSYPLMKKVNLNYSFSYIPQLPSLNQLSNITQRSDNYLLHKGNPELRTEQKLTNQLRFNLRDRHWIGYLKLAYNHTFTPIFNEVYYIGNRTFVSQPMNYDGNRNFNTEIRIGYNGIFNHFNIRGTFGYNHFNTYNDTFSHQLNHFYWSILGELYWNKWELSAYYLKPKKQLIGETILTGENNADISLAYHLNNNFSLTLTLMYPFCKKGAQYASKNLSMQNPSEKEIYIKNNANMILLRMNYTVNFGKGFNKNKRNLNNKDFETGIVKVQE